MKKTNAPFTSLISSDEKELYIGGFGVAVVNGAISGGQVFSIDEDADSIKVFFQYFGTKIGEEIRFRPSCEMKFGKQKNSPVLARHDGCVILTENEESHLLLYPNSMRVLEKHRVKK